MHSLDRVPLCFITKTDQGHSSRTYRYKNIQVQEYQLGTYRYYKQCLNRSLTRVQIATESILKCLHDFYKDILTLSAFVSTCTFMYIIIYFNQQTL